MPEPLQNIPIAPITTQPTAPIWVNWFNSVFYYLKRSPTISTGTAAPTTTPSKVGDMFVDTMNADVYVATGTTNSSDWTVLN